MLIITITMMIIMVILIIIIIKTTERGLLYPLRGCDRAEKERNSCHLDSRISEGKVPSSIIFLSFIREIRRLLATRVYCARHADYSSTKIVVDLRRSYPVPFLLPFDPYWLRCCCCCYRCCCCCCWFSNNIERRKLTIVRDPPQLFLPSIPLRRAIFVDMPAGAIPSRLSDATKFTKRKKSFSSSRSAEYDRLCFRSRRDSL